MNKLAPKKIAYYLRSGGNLHYFAALKPYLDRFLKQGIYQNFLVVRHLYLDAKLSKDYEGYTHLLTSNCDLDSYDLVLTPSFLRAEERTDRTRAVQIFHGMSDKPFTYERDFSNYLLCLCVGQRQVERLLEHECNRTIRWVTIGYPKFDNPPTRSRLFNNDKKTIIYCPTWRKGNISSIEIFLDNPDVVEQLVSHYNLIVKPHPNIFNPDREYYASSIVERLQSIPGIVLIRSGNAMPWFAQADLFVGDISAAGYEWLYRNRPAVFLNPQPGVLQPSNDVSSMTYLWQCGDVCNDIAQLTHLIDRNLQRDRYQDIRESLLHYSVFNPRDNQATERGIRCIEQLLHERCFVGNTASNGNTISSLDPSALN